MFYFVGFILRKKKLLSKWGQFVNPSGQLLTRTDLKFWEEERCQVLHEFGDRKMCQSTVWLILREFWNIKMCQSTVWFCVNLGIKKCVEQCVVLREFGNRKICRSNACFWVKFGNRKMCGSTVCFCALIIVMIYVDTNNGPLWLCSSQLLASFSYWKKFYDYYSLLLLFLWVIIASLLMKEPL